MPAHLGAERTRMPSREPNDSVRGRVAETRPRRVHAAVTIATAACVACVLARWAWTTGLWCDELLFLRAIRLGPVAGLLESGSSHPPLVRWILAPLAGSDASDGAWRTLSIAASVACVFVWSAILRRTFADRAVATMLVPVCALNAAWAAVAYQLVPYACLAFFAALHAWSALRMLERPDRRSIAFFATTAALAAWTHFFGLALLAADVVLLAAWLVARAIGRAQVRAWLLGWGAAIVLAAAVVPLLAHYRATDAPYPIVDVSDFGQRFALSSRRVFEAVALFRAHAPTWTWTASYAALAALAFAAWRARRSDERARARVARAWVVGAAASAGLPALQLYSLVARAPFFERYASFVAWACPVALVLAASLLPRRVGTWSARVAAAALLALGVARFADGTGTKRVDTLDWTPVVDVIAERRAPNDAFLAQDFDLWRGPSNFDRLWFERYGRELLPVVHGPWTRRREIYERGLDLDALAPSIERVWVFSSLFGPRWLARMPSARATGWRLGGLVVFEQEMTLALFVRTTSPGR